MTRPYQCGKFQRNRRPSLAPEARKHPGDYLDSARAGMNGHGASALLQPKRRKQARYAEHVVEMAVSQ